MHPGNLISFVFKKELIKIIKERLITNFMERLEITIEKSEEEITVYPSNFLRRKAKKIATSYFIGFFPPVPEVNGNYICGERSFCALESSEIDVSQQVRTNLQKFLREQFYHLPSRNPERRPVSIILKNTMDENSRRYLEYLTEQYQKAQGVKVEIHQASEVSSAS